LTKDELGIEEIAAESRSYKKTLASLASSAFKVTA